MWTTIYNFLVANKFLNSSLFLGLITLTVGFTALFIYKKQRRDERQDAATVLLAEISKAVALLPGLVKRFKANSQDTLNENLMLMQSESWSKFKYLFLNYLKTEEWEALELFYKNALNYDSAVLEYQSYIFKNMGQSWVSIHKNYYETAREYYETNPKATELDALTYDRILNFTNQYLAKASALALYIPQKPANDAGTALDNIDRNILISSVGSRLGVISNPRSSWKRKNSNNKK